MRLTVQSARRKIPTTSPTVESAAQWSGRSGVLSVRANEAKYRRRLATSTAEPNTIATMCTVSWGQTRIATPAEAEENPMAMLHIQRLTGSLIGTPACGVVGGTRVYRIVPPCGSRYARYQVPALPAVRPLPHSDGGKPATTRRHGVPPGTNSEGDGCHALWPELALRPESASQCAQRRFAAGRAHTFG